MKCVIIDSGINNINHSNIIDKKAFVIEDGLIVERNDVTDMDGHGTACYDIINKYYKNAQYIILKILEKGRGSALQLEAALEYCMSIECEIINISMSIVDEIKRPKALDDLLKKLCVEKKVIIVSSYPNNGRSGFPASSKYVWGIKGEVMEDYEWEIINRNEKSKDLLINIIPERTNRSNGVYYFFGGNSKATAIAAALIMEQLDDGVSKKDLFELKSFNRQRLSWEKYIKNNILHSIKNNNYYRLSDCLGLNGIEENEDLISQGYIRPDNILSIVKKIEKEYHIAIGENIKFSDFISIGNIARLVNNNGGSI
ncbi:MAG: S8 family serine peptidase [Pseudobutyrivibrio sp.]|nr:S8 family serine peptidase [Pseudobutyrivibrio sp.]